MRGAVSRFYFQGAMEWMSIQLVLAAGNFPLDPLGLNVVKGPQKERQDGLSAAIAGKNRQIRMGESTFFAQRNTHSSKRGVTGEIRAPCSKDVAGVAGSFAPRPRKSFPLPQGKIEMT